MQFDADYFPHMTALIQHITSDSSFVTAVTIKIWCPSDYRLSYSYIASHSCKLDGFGSSSNLLYSLLFLLYLCCPPCGTDFPLVAVKPGWRHLLQTQPLYSESSTALKRYALEDCAKFIFLCPITVLDAIL